MCEYLLIVQWDKNPSLFDSFQAIHILSGIIVDFWMQLLAD